MDRQEHWEGVYQTRRPDEVSWFQPHASLSVELIVSAMPDRDAPILDVGGGASMLVDDLLREGYRDITVLDLAASALQTVADRLGSNADRVSFLTGDVTDTPLPAASVALWHDRAVFHFLTDPVDRRRYLEQVSRCVMPGGLVLVATFAEDGPTRCSGLEVARYSPSALHSVFGGDFELLESRREVHQTPAGATQPFTYCLCRFRPSRQAAVNRAPDGLQNGAT